MVPAKNKKKSGTQLFASQNAVFPIHYLQLMVFQLLTVFSYRLYQATQPSERSKMRAVGTGAGSLAIITS